MGSRRHRILHITTGLVLALSTGAFAGGQEVVCQESRGGAAADAEEANGSCYYEMNWYRTIKLGTAPFFNAELAKKAKVAYSFDVDRAATAQFQADELYRSGKLVPAGLGDDGTFWVPASFADHDLAGATETLRNVGYENVVYLGEDEKLPGGVVGDAVVAWEPIPWRAATDREREH